MTSKKRPGKRPNQVDDSVREPKHDHLVGYPVLCLRHLRDGYGIKELSKEQCADFLTKWAQRSRISWDDVTLGGKHALGSEWIAKNSLKVPVPDNLHRDRYLALRYHDKLPVVGFRNNDVFHALWIAKNFHEVYSH